MITNSVDSIFLPNVTYEDPLIQGQLLSGLNQMQPLGKNIYKVPKYVIIAKSLPKKDVARP
jgi:hypothetical protein